MAATPELELRDAPSDGISAVKFSPLHTNLLLASAWDATLRLYDVGQNVLRASVPYKSPLLDCCFSNTTSAFAGAVDGANRKRICQLPKYPTSIASLAFNENGTLLAIASSYTFEEGEKDHPPDAIFIHKVLDSDVKPKPRTR